MNTFAPLMRVIQRETADDHRLGKPARDEAQLLRRREIMARLAGGRGWRVPTAALRTNAQGLTRGERKQKARQAANARAAMLHSQTSKGSPQ